MTFKITLKNLLHNRQNVLNIWSIFMKKSFKKEYTFFCKKKAYNGYVLGKCKGFQFNF